MRTALTNTAPILVRLIAPEPLAPQEPPRMAEPLPVKPRVAPVKPIARAPVITTAPEAPSATLAPPVQPAPLPPLESARESSAVTPQAAALAAAPAPSVSPPPQLVPPSFNADYLANPAPAYPPLSRRVGEEGKVILRVFVSEQGLPTQIEMRASSGHPRLDEAALDTVKHWKFVPARRGDMPLSAWVLVPIAFSLRSR